MKGNTERQTFFKLICVLFIAFVGVSAVEISVKPTTIKLGFTRFLELKCSASPYKTANLTNLISLNILHSTTSETTGFRALSSIDVFDGVKVFHQSTAYGYINSDEESYLFMNVSFPSRDDAGWYMCEVHGVNPTGHPVHFSTTFKVLSEKPDFDSMIEEFRSLKAYAYNTYRYTDLLRSRFEKARATVFDISSVFNGSQYLMSKPSPEVFAGDARATCELYGAHIANFNSFNEWNFAKNFTTSLGKIVYVMIDGTDEGHEAQWVSTRPNTNLTYFNWYPGYPNNDPASNCLYMYSGYEFKMYSASCVLIDPSNLPRFLCKLKKM